MPEDPILGEGSPELDDKARIRAAYRTWLLGPPDIDDPRLAAYQDAVQTLEIAINVYGQAGLLRVLGLEEDKTPTTGTEFAEIDALKKRLIAQGMPADEAEAWAIQQMRREVEGAGAGGGAGGGAGESATARLNATINAISLLVKLGDMSAAEQDAEIKQAFELYESDRKTRQENQQSARQSVLDELGAWKDYTGGLTDVARLNFETFKSILPYLTSRKEPFTLGGGPEMTALEGRLGLPSAPGSPITPMPFDTTQFSGDLLAALQAAHASAGNLPSPLSEPTFGEAYQARTGQPVPPPARNPALDPATGFVGGLLGF